MPTAAASLEIGKRKFAPIRRELSRGLTRKIDPKSVENVEKMIHDRGIKIVDLRFVDMLGLWQHFSIPSEELLNYKSLSDSIWIDGIG